MHYPIVLYDGVCGLCNRSVQFILRRDRAGVFRFASLQGQVAAGILARHGANPSDLDTMYVVVGGNEAQERLLPRSDAVLYIGRRLGGLWGFLAGVMELVPRAVRDWGYAAVARHRYQVFGRYDACPLPRAETRERFLDW
jgi:predicted DCC family thiol-disulfide oxidoreductase YuxK